MTSREKTLTIQTPEGIVFPLIMASPITRLLALVLDIAVIYVASTVVSTLLRVIGVLSADLAGAFWSLASFGLSFGYPIVMEWLWQGQTIGKKLLRIQVMDEQGLRLQFSQVVVRNLLRFVDAMPFFYLVGGITCFINSRGQRIGDIAANTIVVHHPRIPEPDLEQILTGKYNSFREHPHLAARLRQNLGPQETAVLLHALLRRDTLDPVARPNLFAGLREYVDRVVTFPTETTDGISDEQYIRNVLEILLR